MCIRDRGRVGLRRRPEAWPPRSATALDQAPTVTPEEPHPTDFVSLNDQNQYVIRIAAESMLFITTRPCPLTSARTFSCSGCPYSCALSLQSSRSRARDLGHLAL